MSVNQALREHVTSIGFALTLSKSQIHLLVCLTHFGGYDGYCNSAHRISNFVTSARALEARGLLEPGRGIKLTKAAHIVVALLKEAGIYDEHLERAGVVAEAVSA